MKASDFTEAELDRIVEIAVQAKKDYQEIANCIDARSPTGTDLSQDRLWLKMNKRLIELATINLEIPAKKPVPPLFRSSLFSWERHNVTGVSPFGEVGSGTGETWSGCDLYMQGGNRLQLHVQDYKNLCAGKVVTKAGIHFQLKEQI